MIINYELIEEDFLRFNLHHIEESPSQKKIYWGLRILLPLFCAVVIYLVGTALFDQAYVYWSILAIGFFIGWVSYYPTQHKKILLDQTRKLLSEGDNSSLFGKKTMTIKEDVVTVTGEDEQVQIKRENIKTIKQYEEMILLYNSSVSAIIIPTRNLTPYEIEELINLKPKITSENNN
ncbi:YcxB family protein [Alkalibacterium sp. f15]|uniref:YcxB family protein n=1 Tax=Alkalibacterium sp. f15 TaxID=3414029 RepID=UPI003BF875E2